MWISKVFKSKSWKFSLLAVYGIAGLTLLQVYSSYRFHQFVSVELRQRGIHLPEDVKRGYPMEAILYLARRTPRPTKEEVESYIVRFSNRQDAVIGTANKESSIVYDFSIGWIGKLRPRQLVVHFRQDTDGAFRLTYIKESWFFWWDEYLVTADGVRQL